MKRVLPILLLVIFLFAGCVGPTAGDATVSGTVLFRPDFARYGNTVFFEANEALFRMGLDGSNRMKVADGCGVIADVTDTEVFFLWRGEILRTGWDGSGRTVLAGDAGGLAGCSDGWIYYTDYDEKSLVRVSRDGKRKEYFQGLYAWPVLSDGKSVVFTKSGVLYYLADDGAQPEKLLDGLNEVCRREDNAFAVTNGGIIKIRLADISVTRLTDGASYYLQTDGDRVYFMAQDGNLCSVKTDGSYPAQLTSDGISTYTRAFGTFVVGQQLFTVEDGWVYYLGKDKRLYRVSGDGKRTQRLTESTVYPVDVSGGQITYINSKFGPEDTDMIQIHSEEIIRRMNADGTGGRAKDLTGRGLNTGTFRAIGEYLYLDRWTELEQKSYRVRKDGQGREEMALEDGLSYREARDCQFGQYRFYMKKDVNGIFCSNADGSGEFQLFGGNSIRLIGASDCWVYYSKGISSESSYVVQIRRIRPDGTGEALVLDGGGEPVSGPALAGEWIYYCNGKTPGRFRRVNCETGEVQLVNKHNAYDIRSDGQYVYYIKDQTDGVWRIALDGGEAQCVVPDPVTAYRLNGDWLLYQVGGRVEDVKVVRFR